MYPLLCGTVSERGTYAELMTKGCDFASLMAAHGITSEDEEEEEADGIGDIGEEDAAGGAGGKRKSKDAGRRKSKVKAVQVEHAG